MLSFSSQIPRFSNLAKNVSQSPEFKEWLTSRNPERNVPQLWASIEGAETTPISDAMNKLLAIQVRGFLLLLPLPLLMLLSISSSSFFVHDRIE